MKITAGLITGLLVWGLGATGVLGETHELGRIAESIGPFVDEQTIVVGRADMVRFDAEGFCAELVKSLQKAGEEEVAKEFGEVVKKIGQWKQQFAKAGGKEVYFLVRFEERWGSRVCGVVPLAEGADAEALRNLLRYGSPEAPERARAHGPFGAAEAEVIRGALILAEEEDLARIRTGRPVARPELSEALVAGGAADVQMVLMPNAQLRELMGKALLKLPEEMGGGAGAAGIAEGVRWQSMVVNGPPRTSMEIVIQAKDEEAAKAIGDLQTRVTKSITAKLEETGDDPAAKTWAAFLLALKPQVEKDRLLLALNDEQISRLIVGTLVPSVVEAQAIARRVLSATNMRQIALGCMLYAQTNFNGEPPEDLEALVAGGYGGPGFDKVLINPQQPQRKIGYVYIPPDRPLHLVERPGGTILLYEAYDKWGKGINVGFVDGHVEFIADEARFKKLLEESRPAIP